jgi:hypothetical protein
MRARFVALGALTASFFALAPTSQAGNEVSLLVLKERGVGTSAQIQPYVDKFVAIAQKKLGWSAAKGTFHSERKAAEAFIDSDKPQYGILSLSAYLAMKDPRKLDTIGQVSASRAGGQQYFIVSKSASDIAGCKGQKLATDLGDDDKFVDRVVAAGAFKLADFTLQATKRPLQGLKMVIHDEAKCALIDDAQMAELASIEGGKDVKSVWKSAMLPPMAVVAFPSATTGDKAAFKSALASLCEGDGKSTCSEVGIQSLKPAADETYAQVLAAYRKDK